MSKIHRRGAWLALLALGASFGNLPAQDNARQQVERIHALVLLSNLELAALRLSTRVSEARLRAAGFGPAAGLAIEVEEIPDGLALTRAGSVRAALIREFRPRGFRASQRALADIDVRRTLVLAEATERRLGAQATALLVQTLGASRIAARLAAEDTLLAGAEEALRSRFAVGEARYVDVLRLRTERLRVRTDLAAASAEGRISRVRLLAMVSDTAAGELARLVEALASDTSIAAASESFLPGALDSLTGRSAAVRMAALATAEAVAGRHAAGMAQRPVLSASLGLQRFEGASGTFDLGPVLGASLSLPFTNRARAPSLAAADLAVSVARSHERAVVNLARASSRTAQERYLAALDRARFFDSALLRGARDERETALAAYRTGTLSLVELLGFERALCRAEIDRIRSQIEAAAALADLFAGLTATDEPLPPARPGRAEP